jgi:hypothetical protein
MIGGVIILTKGRRNKKNRSEVQIELERDASSFYFFSLGCTNIFGSYRKKELQPASM